jgi:hypothetical protein
MPDEIWTRVAPRRVCSNFGYGVEILGRDGLLYIEGESEFHLDTSEPLSGGGFAVSTKSIQGSAERKQAVIVRLRAGLESLGSWLQVDEE